MTGAFSLPAVHSRHVSAVDTSLSFPFVKNKTEKIKIETTLILIKKARVKCIYNFESTNEHFAVDDQRWFSTTARLENNKHRIIIGYIRLYNVPANFYRNAC